MTTHLTTRIADETPRKTEAGRFSFRTLAPVALLVMLTGCQSDGRFRTPEEVAVVPSEPIELRAGDVLRVSFPGSPNLDTQPQAIQRDGYITLPLVNQVKAAGMTPAELEKDLVKRYSKELASAVVSVTVVSSSYSVYVTGAVLRPGKISSDHPISALEAIMEAGGFDYTRANLKAVRVVRNEGGQTKHYTLNLKETLQGKGEPFYLKPSDIVYVRERFNWF